MTGPSPPTVAFPVPGPLPISAGPVTVVNGHLGVNGQRQVYFGCNFDAAAIWGLLNPNKAGVYVMDPAQEAVFVNQLDILEAAGVSAVRILGLTASNINPIFAAGTTTAFDPGKQQALDWFLWQLKQRNIRYGLVLNYARLRK